MDNTKNVVMLGNNVVASKVRNPMFDHAFKLMDDSAGGIGPVVFIRKLDAKKVESSKPESKPIAFKSYLKKSFDLPSEDKYGPGLLG